MSGEMVLKYGRKFQKRPWNVKAKQQATGSQGVGGQNAVNMLLICEADRDKRPPLWRLSFATRNLVRYRSMQPAAADEPVDNSNMPVRHEVLSSHQFRIINQGTAAQHQRVYQRESICKMKS